MYYYRQLALLLVISCAQLPKNRSEINTWTQLPLNQQLKPFVSDGCSYWPEGTQSNKTKWIRCCIVHDLAYWQGGSELQKEQVDKEFNNCIEKVEGELMADLMETGVEWGGTPRFQTDFRWGYGWNYNRGYLPLTKKEKVYADSISPKKGEDLRKFLDKDALDPEIDKIEAQIL